MTTSGSLPEGGGESAESASATTSYVSNNVKPDELLLKMSADVSRLAQIQLEADRNRRTSEAELIQKVHEIMTTQKDSESLQRRQSMERSTTQTLLQLEQSKSEQLIQELKELNRKVSSEQESYQVHVTKLEMQLQQIKEKNLVSEQLRTSVENEKVELQNLISQLQSRTEILENELQAEREQLHQKESYIQELKRQADSKNEHLSQQNSQLQYIHSETQEKYDHMVRSYETLETTMQSKEDELRRYECDIVPTLEATIEMERDTIARMEEAYYSQRQNEIEEYQEEKSKLVEQLQRVRDESDREKMKYSNCHQEYTEIREEYESYKTEKDTLVKTLQQQMNDEIHKLTNLNAELQMSNHTFVEQQKQINDALEESIAQYELCDKEKGALTTQLQQTLQQYDDMKEVITNKDSEISVQVQQLNDQLVKEREHAKQLQMESDRIVHHQNQEITSLQQQVKQINQERDEARSNMLGYNEREHKLYQQLMYYENVRRTLHSKLIQFMGNIRVFVRVRPTLENETMQQNQNASNNILSNRSNSTKRKLNDHDEEPIFHFPGMYNCSNDSSIPLMDDESSTSKDMQQRRTSKRPATSTTNSGSSSTDLTKNIIEVVAPYKDRGGLNDRRSKWKFGFDHVFTPKHTQRDVWEATEPLIQCGVDGYNVTIFAYGQTGSGVRIVCVTLTSIFCIASDHS
jgi:chromosome segregation ATPase